MAQQLHCSPASVYRQSMSAFKLTPMQYLIELRLQRAKYLLIHSDWNLTSIAQQIGYKEGVYLSRLFKKKLSLSPQQYREKFSEKTS